MKKILVPTDFSICAEKAIDFAVQSAKVLPAEIILHHAFDLQGDIYTDYMGVTKEYNQSLLNEVVHKLNKIKDAIFKKEGITVKTIVSKNSFKKAIHEVIEANSIDLIIMGTMGASGIRKILFGSNTASIIADTPIPVLIIPVEYKWKKPGNFLFATNHFETDSCLLDFLFEIADLYMAKVNAVVFTDEEKDKAETILKHAYKIPEYEKMIRDKYEEPTFEAAHIFGKDFIDSVQDYITKNDIDILAMVTHKRDFLNRIFNPGITRRMTYHTKIPLLAIPTNEQA